MEALTSRLRHHSADGISLIHTARAWRPFCLQTPDDLPPSLSHALLSASDFPL